jgi:predicted enzyme related to lactoylglutathione lyase
LRHIAFEVDDVQAARDEVLAAGGAAVGEVVTTNAGPRSVTWCYVTDPEGNVIELQRWASIL